VRVATIGCFAHTCSLSLFVVVLSRASVQPFRCAPNRIEKSEHRTKHAKVVLDLVVVSCDSARDKGVFVALPHFRTQATGIATCLGPESGIDRSADGQSFQQMVAEIASQLVLWHWSFAVGGRFACVLLLVKVQEGAIAHGFECGLFLFEGSLTFQGSTDNVRSISRAQSHHA